MKNHETLKFPVKIYKKIHRNLLHSVCDIQQSKDAQPMALAGKWRKVLDHIVVTPVETLLRPVCLYHFP